MVYTYNVVEIVALQLLEVWRGFWRVVAFVSATFTGHLEYLLLFFRFVFLRDVLDLVSTDVILV